MERALKRVEDDWDDCADDVDLYTEDAAEDRREQDNRR